MSAALLVEAATLLRSRVETLSSYQDPWIVQHDQEDVDGDDGAEIHLDDVGIGYCAVATVEQGENSVPLAQHIAALAQPDVALTIANWLEVTARDAGSSSLSFKAAEDFALAYLGRAA